MSDTPRKFSGPAHGRPLFAQIMQPVLKTFYGIASVMIGGFAAGIVCTVASRPLLLNLIALPMLGMFWYFFSFFRRTYGVYGSSEGIEIAQFGKVQMFPWSKVGQLDVEPWYRSYPVRIVHLSLLEEPEKNIVFFAMDGDVEEFEAMRAAHTRA